MTEVKRRRRRTNEELIVEVDKAIEKKKAEISRLEERRERLLHPVKKTRQLGRTGLINKALASGMTVEEIKKKLGL